MRQRSKIKVAKSKKKKQEEVTITACMFNVRPWSLRRYDIQIKLKATNTGLSTVIDYVFAVLRINRKKRGKRERERSAFSS